MNKEKIALLIDSGTDVATEYLARDNVFVLPLRIIFDDAEYIDKVTITSDELFVRMEEGIPSTSLPTGEDILAKITEIREKGYEKIIAITISSALSGTNSAIKNIVAEYAGDLEVFVLDTKNISIGAGMFVLAASNAIEAGEAFTDITTKLTSKLNETKIYFTVGSVEYLKHGGRISSFAAMMSGVFNIKPIITCDDSGAYILAAKERGKKKSYDKLIELTKEFAHKLQKPYMLAIVYGRSREDFEAFKEDVRNAFPEAQSLVSVLVSPALGVHTGPDAMGLAIQTL